MRPPPLLLLSVTAVSACNERPAADHRAPPSAAAPAGPSAANAPAPASASSARPRTPAERADDFYARRCQACHGPAGAGDGPGAAVLKPPPRSLTDAAWQKSVTDDDIAAIIVQGGAALKKSPAMPGSPELERDEQLLGALVAKVRSFGK